MGQKAKLIENVLKPIKTYYTVFRDKKPYNSVTFDISDHEDISFIDMESDRTSIQI